MTFRINPSHLLFAAVAGLALNLASAFARPGTPAQELVEECYPGQLGGTVTRFDGPPSLCVSFKNAARKSESVTFEIQMKEAGRGVYNIALSMKGKVKCLWRPLSDVPNSDQAPAAEKCTPASNMQGIRRATNWPGEMGFVLINQKFATEYCFRFRTRDVDTDMVSELWSNWACTTTTGAPRKPTPPRIASLSTSDPHWTADMKTMTPHQVYVAWGATGGTDIGHYTLHVEAADRQHERLVPQVFNLAKHYYANDTSVVFDIPAGMVATSKGAVPEFLVSVCAHNAAGSACSRPKSTAVTGSAKGPGDFNDDMVDKTPRIPGAPIGADKVGNAGVYTTNDAPYIGAQTQPPKGSTKATDGIFARPKGSSNVNDMMTAPPASSPGDGVIARTRSASATANFTATWNTVTAASTRYTMTLSQNGNQVTGSYASVDGAVTGTLSGTVEGDTLIYRWQEGPNGGMGKFRLGDDGASFSGWWNSSATDPNAVSGAWNGTRR
jgi:hypothetical protein